MRNGPTTTRDGREREQEEGELLVALPRQGPDRMPQEMRITLERYQGHAYVRAQLWADTVNGWRPLAGKIATFRKAEVVDVIQALRRAAEAMSAEAPDGRRGDGSPTPSPSRSPRGGRGEDGGHWADRLPKPSERAAGQGEFSEF